MKYLFGEEGLTILESLCFTPTLFAFDYDGTLARIVAHPPEAKMSAQTERLFQELSSLAPVAVVSGRSMADLRRLLGVMPRYLIGNHGVEGLRASASSLGPVHEMVRRWRTSLEHQLGRVPGVEIEDKDFSLAVHFRRSRRKKSTKLSILEIAASLTPPPRLIMGKCVVNLVPRGAPHKGMALLELMLECNVKTAFYIGDDDTDEDVFALPDARILSVRVGRKEGSAARFFVKRQADVNDVMKRIIRFLKG